MTSPLPSSLQVLSHPKLWSAAYATSQRYTQSDVRSIVEYARLRGVRVVDAGGAVRAELPDAAAVSHGFSGLVFRGETPRKW
jgi:hypothetical protein